MESVDKLPLIEILSEPGIDSIADMLNLDWEITEFTEKGIDFKLYYVNPLEVSQNDEPDIVKVKLNLSQFTDEYGQPMEDGQIIEVEVPRQIPSEEDAVAIEATGQTSETGCFAVMGSNLVVNFILAASLNHLWSMINGLQLSTHMQLFSLKFPANAGFLVRFLVSVATFDLLPIEVIWFFFELPDRGSFDVNFESSGYEYKHVIENLGTSMFFVQVYIVTLFLMVITR